MFAEIVPETFVGPTLHAALGSATRTISAASTDPVRTRDITALCNKRTTANSLIWRQLL